MKPKIIIQVFLILIVVTFLISFTSSVSISIDMKPSFNIGEKVSFDYTISSETPMNIEYLASVNCPNSPMPLLEIKNTSLIANIPFKETYVYMSTLRDDIEPQKCNATIGILNPEISEKKQFELKTNPSFDFQVLTCKDENCNEKTSVFILNQNIYLKYDSNVNPAVEASLTYPNKQKKQIILPTNIKAEQIGTYELNVNASKEGYKTINKKIQFGVIASEPEIKNADFSAKQNKPFEFMQIFSSPILIIVWVGLLVLILAVVQIVRRILKNT